MNTPFPNKKTSTLIGVKSTDAIISKYMHELNIDVSRYFRQLPEIQIYRCNQTGYKFYYPFDISGDSFFYEHLQQYEWYYMPWKWEHEQAAKLIKSGMKVLEVGCGMGGFLKEVSNRVPDIEITGLELNQSAVERGKSEGLNILAESIEEHAEAHPGTYDLVCSFQVLEHIADVKSFIEGQIKALKKGGKIIVSVPNNRGFLGDSYNILNMPPHHMGLWDKISLKKMGDYFGLKYHSTHFEPLQPYHSNYFQRVKQSKLRSYPKLIRHLAGFPLIESLLFPTQYRAFTIQMTWIK